MTLIATRPEPGIPRPYAFPSITRISEGGGVVVAAHLPGQILATAALLLDAGAGREAVGREGTATVLAKALEEGTASRDSAAFALALEGLGAELSTSVDWDAFRVGVSVPVDLLPSAAVRVITPTVSASAGTVTAVCTEELTPNRPNRRLIEKSPRMPYV